MHSLPIFVNLEGAPVILVGDGDAATPKRQLLERAGAKVLSLKATDEAAALPLARLAIVAVDEAACAARWTARLRGAGLLVNAVDRPELCDFSIPAFVDRDPVLVAISTGGASASLAKALRERIEAWLPPSLGGLARAIRAARAKVSAKLPTARQRRLFWDQALAPGGPLDPTLDRADDAAARIAAALDATAMTPPEPEVIALASVDADDLTLRMLRLLQRADVLIVTPEVPASVLDRSRRDAKTERASSLPEAQAAARRHAQAGRFAVVVTLAHALQPEQPDA